MNTLADATLWRALAARDARFDGRFFVGVTSTGVYCRPICRVRLPRLENCRFFTLAAQAEAAGFRPCLRCRPELAPQSAAMRWSAQDATRTLVQQAAALIDNPDGWRHASGPDMEQIAARLGVSSRHLRRIFEAHLGISPLQYLQTRRLLTAKQLLADTRLSMPAVAAASGFASVRRFNAAIRQRYGLPPSALRPARNAARAERWAHGAVTLMLGWRPPYDVASMLGFFARRALGGLERVEGCAYTRTVALHTGAHEHHGWLRLELDELRARVRVQASESLAPVLPALVARIRALLDLDADPQAIAAVLHADFPASDGLRVPGAMDGFELAVRAVLGQQITVAAARTLGTRLVAALGAPLATPWPGVERLFPAPQAIADASNDTLGALGITRQRQTALHTLAREVMAQRLPLHPGADPVITMSALRALPGVGDWTAQYIAMRALRWPDAFPAGDVALQKALGVTTARAALTAAHAWQPWRSYAVLRAWHQGAATPSASSRPAIAR